MKPIVRTLVQTSLLIAALIGATDTHAQTTDFAFQGFLTDGGVPANGVYDLTFTVFDASSGGSPIGTSNVVNDLGITNGLFTVPLNFGSAPFDGSNRWVQVAVRPGATSGTFTDVTPRQQVTSTPYAIRAANFNGTVAASQLTGTISSNNIGAGTITSLMLAAGAVGSDQLSAGAVTTTALADAAVTAPKVATVSNWFLLTITNRTPAASELFGISVAALGTDRVLIGASGNGQGAFSAGAAYLFNTRGTLLTTFTNPTPAPVDSFGWSVAVAGTDRVLIGAPYDRPGADYVGSAYLFSTNGVLLTTFTNPTPVINDQFGASVAALGSECVLIGASGDDTGVVNAGAAYLFNTDGILLTTFTNPTPAASDLFASSVATVGTGWVLIGAPGDDTDALYSGAAYLFSTNGTLLTTFANPTPAPSDLFGWSVLALGTDRVLIGAPRDDAGALDSGVAYLFSTNGTLLTTIVNPAPGVGDSFGISGAAVGTDQMLITAEHDTTQADDEGSAYLFSTNGALLATFTNPYPASGERFGYSAAALVGDWVLIGTPYEDTGNRTDAGSAYLFSLETFTPGLVAQGVSAGSITTSSLEDAAVTAAKLDPSIGVWTRSGNHVYRLTGKVGIGTSSFTSNRLEVAGMVGATAFNTTSDRAAKQDFTAVDPQSVLAKVTTLPIMRWRFKDFPGALHLGPTAQDFRAAFGLGVDDKSIATVDADGVALTAIQALNTKIEDKERRSEITIQEIKAENAYLNQRLEKLENLLKQKVNGGEK